MIANNLLELTREHSCSSDFFFSLQSLLWLQLDPASHFLCYNQETWLDVMEKAE